jgi:hypothetical protein
MTNYNLEDVKEFQEHINQTDVETIHSFTRFFYFARNKKNTE